MTLLLLQLALAAGRMPAFPGHDLRPPISDFSKTLSLSKGDFQYFSQRVGIRLRQAFVRALHYPVSRIRDVVALILYPRLRRSPRVYPKTQNSPVRDLWPLPRLRPPLQKWSIRISTPQHPCSSVYSVVFSSPASQHDFLISVRSAVPVLIFPSKLYNPQ